MKVINIPTRVFAQGDRVFTPEGVATVLHDELENFDTTGNPEQRADQVIYQSTIIVHLDETNCNYQNPGQDAHLDRVYVTHLEQFKKTDQPERCRYCGAETKSEPGTPVAWRKTEDKEEIHTCLSCHRNYIVV